MGGGAGETPWEQFNNLKQFRISIDILSFSNGCGEYKYAPERGEERKGRVIGLPLDRECPRKNIGDTTFTGYSPGLSELPPKLRHFLSINSFEKFYTMGERVAHQKRLDDQ